MYKFKHLDSKTVELAGIAASVAGRWKPCLDYHFKKAFEIGCTAGEAEEAIELGKTCGEYVFERYLHRKDGKNICIPCSGYDVYERSFYIPQS